MIKTIILDIGKVLVDYDWDDFLTKIFDDERVRAKVKNAIFGHGVWNELDRGVLSEDELLAEFTKYAPDYAKEIRRFYDTAAESLTLQPYTRAFIKQLKADGYQVLYLSNWSRLIIDQRPQLLDFLELTDGGVFSFEAKMIKPNEDIYRFICEKYNLVPSECVFIDDKKENVLTAREVGMQGIWYKDYDQMIEELNKL